MVNVSVTDDEVNVTTEDNIVSVTPSSDDTVNVTTEDNIVLITTTSDDAVNVTVEDDVVSINTTSDTVNIGTVNGVTTLSQLTDINVTDLNNEDILIYNSTSGLWENVAFIAGDMLKTIYDPASINGDVFDMDNMVEGTAKILTSAERTSISNNSSKVSFPEAPIDGSQYVRSDGSWEVVSIVSPPVDSVNSKTGVVVLDSDDISEGSSNLYLTSAEKALIVSALQSGDNISELTNDSGFITAYTVTDTDLVGLNISNLTNDTGFITDYTVTNSDLTGLNNSELINDSNYLVSFTESDPVFLASQAYNITSADITNLSNLNSAAYVDASSLATSSQGTLADSALQPSDNVSELTNDSGYLTSFVESDPVFIASPAHNITSNDINNLSNLSNINTGDQDISGIDINTSTITGVKTKTDFISVSQNVDLDNIQSDVATNNDKVGITPTQASNITTNNDKISFDVVSSTRLADTYGTNTGDQDLPTSGVDFDPVGTDNSDNNAINTNYENDYRAANFVSGIDYEPAKGANDNYVTDAEKIIISNTSNINTGDETSATIKTKLGISILSGSNTGDQDISGIATNASDIDDLETNKQDNISLTTTGTSGASTLVGNTLNIPQYAGDVTGPTGAVDENIVLFNGTSGKVIEDSGINKSAILANTAKVGITPSQADAITANTDKISFDSTSSAKLSSIEENAEVNIIDSVSDTSEIDLTITGKALSANIKSSSIDETKLDASVNSSLDKADSALQNESDPVFVASQAHNITANDITNLSNLSGINSGDQDISGIITNANDIDNIEAKTDFITVTQAVNLDTMESDIATNKDKISYTDAADVALNTTHRGLTNNPHSVDKSDVGLGNVPNIDTTNASNITTGTISSSVLPPVALTTVQVASSEAVQLALTTEEGDVVVRSDLNKSYMHNGGSAGTMADFTELQTPTDSVLSVNGETGTVILTTGDLNEDVNHRYVTDDELSILQATSGSNTGDQESSDFTHNNLTGLNDGATYQHITSTQETNFETAYTHSQTIIGNPHDITADDITDVYSETEVDALRQNLSAGSVTHPSYLDNLNGTVTIGSGTYRLYSTSDYTGNINLYSVTGNTFNLVDESTNYIVINYNSGTPVLQLISDSSLINESNIIPIFTIIRQGTDLCKVDWNTAGRGLANKLHNKDVTLNRFQIESGLVLDETGTRNITSTSGYVWNGTKRNELQVVNTTVANNDICLFYHSSGVWTHSTVTQYNNSQYDDGTDLQTIGVNRFVVNWVFRNVDSSKETLCIVLGSGNYTLSQAESSAMPILPDGIVDGCVFIGRIIVQQGASTAYSIEQVQNVALAYSQVSDHNNLNGLDGGTTDEYYHLTSAEYGIMQNTSGVNSGDQIIPVVNVDFDPVGTDNSTDVTVTDTDEIDLTIIGQDLQASIKTSSIDETKLNASVNASLDLADSALQSYTETDPVFVASQAYNIDNDDITNLGNLSGTNSGNNAINTTYEDDYRAANFVAGTDYQVPLVAGTDYLTSSAISAAYQPLDSILTNTTASFTTALASNISDNNDKISYTDATIVGLNTSFRTTPSTVITAGTDLEWNGNTLNYIGSNPFDQDLNTTDNVEFEQLIINGGTLYLNDDSDNFSDIIYSPLTTDTYLRMFKGGYVNIVAGGKNGFYVGNNGTVINTGGDSALDFRVSGSNVSNQYLLFVDVGSNRVGVNNSSPSEILDVVGNIAVSGTVDGHDIDSEMTANNAKVTNATHTGDVTGDTVLTLATVNSNVGSFTNANITVNAKGLITAAVDGAGAGGASVYECTVGPTSGDYATLGAAITAGMTRILVIEDTTETSNIALPSNLIVQGLGMNKVTIDMVTYLFTVSGTSFFTFNDLKFTRAPTSAWQYLFPNGTDKLYLNQISYNVTTVQYGAYILNNTGDYEVHLNNVELNLPNQSSQGLNNSSTNLKSTVNNLKLIGGGTSCRAGAFNYMTINNVIISGTFSAADGFKSWYSTVSNINTSTAIKFSFASSQVSNIYSSADSTLMALQNQCNISNVRFIGSSSNITFSSNYSHLSNCNIGGTITTSGNLNMMTNCVAESGFIIYYDDNIISNCRAGVDAGGGSATITVGSGADRTIINGCRCDAPISNSGTDTVGIGNVVY